MEAVDPNPNPKSNWPTRRLWFGTYNNPNMDTWYRILEHVDPKYVCWCIEEGEKKTQHIQWFIETHTEIMKANLIKKMKGCHVDICRAKHSTQESKDYIFRTGKHINKPGLIDGPHEVGEWTEYTKHQGKRTDLEDVGQDIRDGKSLKEIAINHTKAAIMYHRGIERTIEIINTRDMMERNWMTRMLIITGRPGTGKTRLAYQMTKYQQWQLYTYRGDGWWNNYRGEEIILMDEYENDLSRQMILKLADRYPLQLRTKMGPWINLQAQLIIIISNNKWWKDDDEALKRRATFLTIDTPRTTEWTTTEIENVLAQLCTPINF